MDRDHQIARLAVVGLVDLHRMPLCMQHATPPNSSGAVSGLRVFLRRRYQGNFQETGAFKI